MPIGDDPNNPYPGTQMPKPGTDPNKPTQPVDTAIALPTMIEEAHKDKARREDAIYYLRNVDLTEVKEIRILLMREYESGLPGDLDTALSVIINLRQTLADLAQLHANELADVKKQDVFTVKLSPVREQLVNYFQGCLLTGMEWVLVGFVKKGA